MVRVVCLSVCLKPKDYSSKPLMVQEVKESSRNRLMTDRQQGKTEGHFLARRLMTGSRARLRDSSWPGAAEDKWTLCRAHGIVRLVTVTATTPPNTHTHPHSQQMALRPKQ